MEKDTYLIRAFAQEDIVIHRGEGVYLFDTNEKKYLDFLAGIAVNAIGYGHPEFVQALQEQAQQLIHCSNYFYNEGQLQLAEKLVQKTQMNRVFFTNSGTESNEGAIKIARLYSTKKYNEDRTEILSFRQSFHGRTLGALAATGQPTLQEGFYDNTKGYVYAEYNNIDDVKSKISSRTCAIMMELIQGEGGVIPADHAFVKEIQKLCEERDLIWIVDEVQTGIGRIGKFTSYQYYGIQPDIATFAKGLGGGIPIGAIAVGQKCENTITPGTHGTTFGGNPFATNAALTVLNIIEKEDLMKNVQEVGNYLKKRLREWKAQNNHIQDVRGEGLMIGVELDMPSKPVFQKALSKGLMISATANNVIRLVPPLTIQKKHVDEMMTILKTCL